MIQINYQTATGQYDRNGNQITRWDAKRCSWIVLSKYKREYDNNEIDWWGGDNDFPAGETIEQYHKRYPHQCTANLPDISVQYIFNIEDFKKAFPGEDYQKYPHGYSYCRHWQHLDYKFEEAVEKLKYYIDVGKLASEITITWERNANRKRRVRRTYKMVKASDGEYAIFKSVQMLS